MTFLLHQIQPKSRIVNRYLLLYLLGGPQGTSAIVSVSVSVLVGHAKSNQGVTSSTEEMRLSIQAGVSRVDRSVEGQEGMWGYGMCNRTTNGHSH